ncbi:MAG: acetate--CoA ligase family protein [Rhizobiaceae bacterium]
MTRSLSRLLAPRSIAVIGGNWAAAVIRQTRQMGYDGEIWPIHPDKEIIEGLPAFRSADALPGSPDAAFVGVNRKATIDIVRQLSAIGAGGAVCFASGFREAEADDADGGRLQDALLAAAGNMPVLGPNCYGLINYCDGALLWPDQHGGVRLDQEARGVAIVAQSSNIAINMTMQARGLPVAYVVTAGNQAQTGMSEIAAGLLEDDRVSVLGLYIEGFDSVAGFEQLAARARELHKPIIAMKIGRSEQARAATVSHTASIAGADAASDAFLRRLGIGRVNSIPSFLEALKLLHVCGPLQGNRISSMSCSGGEAALVADSVRGRRVEFPALAATHHDRVKETLGPLVSVANPLDYHTFIWNDETAMTSTFSAMVAGGFDLNLLVIDFPRSDRCSDTDWRATINAFETALAANDAKGALLASLPENLPESWAAECIARGIAPMQGIDEALDAIDVAAFVGEAWRIPAARPVTTGQFVECNVTSLDEAEAKQQLDEFGLPVPPGHRAVNAQEAVSIAKELGFPVALKALGVAHKSELGAVRLGLSLPEDVCRAAKAMTGLGSGLYVERMIEAGVCELIVGVTRDPLFGPVLTIGSGGVLVELLEDSRTLLLPTTSREIEDAILGLKLFCLLDGYRGRPKADLQAAIQAIEAIAGFAVERAEDIVEMDINPLIVLEAGKGVSIADALIVVKENSHG